MCWQSTVKQRELRTARLLIYLLIYVYTVQPSATAPKDRKYTFMNMSSGALLKGSLRAVPSLSPARIPSNVGTYHNDKQARTVSAGASKSASKIATTEHGAIAAGQRGGQTWETALDSYTSQRRMSTANSQVGTEQAPRTDSGYSAICVIARDENVYLREWVEYHKCLGFNKIYLYDHNSSKPMAGDIADHVHSKFVEHRMIEGSHSKYEDGFSSNLERFMTTIQGKAYKDCVDTHGHKHRFLAFIDVDEFVVLFDNSTSNINDFLKRYEDFGGVSLYWALLGSSGHLTPPPGWVIYNYKSCLSYGHKYNTQFKSFVNTAHRPTMYSPHRAIFGDNTSDSIFLVDEHKNRIARGRHKKASHGYAAVYHYATKSKHDFEAKIHRGGGAGVTRPRYYQRLLDRQCKYTCDDAMKTYERTCQANGFSRFSLHHGSLASSQDRSIT